MSFQPVSIATNGYIDPSPSAPPEGDASPATLGIQPQRVISTKSFDTLETSSCSVDSIHSPVPAEEDNSPAASSSQSTTSLKEVKRNIFPENEKKHLYEDEGNDGDVSDFLNTLSQYSNEVIQEEESFEADEDEVTVSTKHTSEVRDDTTLASSSSTGAMYNDWEIKIRSMLELQRSKTQSSQWEDDRPFDEESLRKQDARADDYAEEDIIVPSVRRILMSPFQRSSSAPAQTNVSAGGGYFQNPFTTAPAQDSTGTSTADGDTQSANSKNSQPPDPIFEVQLGKNDETHIVGDNCTNSNHASSENDSTVSHIYDVEEPEHEKDRGSRRRRLVVLLCCCLCIFVALVVTAAVLGATMRDDDKSATNTNSLRSNTPDGTGSGGGVDDGTDGENSTVAPTGEGGMDATLEPTASESQSTTLFPSALVTDPPVVSPPDESSRAPSSEPTPVPSKIPTTSECTDLVVSRDTCHDRREDAIIIGISICDPQPDDWVAIYRDGEDMSALSRNWVAWQYLCTLERFESGACEEGVPYTATLTIPEGVLGRNSYRAYLVRDSLTGAPYEAFAQSEVFEVSRTC